VTDQNDQQPETIPPWASTEPYSITESLFDGTVHAEPHGESERTIRLAVEFPAYCSDAQVEKIATTALRSLQLSLHADVHVGVVVDGDDEPHWV
jgi:hypothetical protein